MDESNLTETCLQKNGLFGLCIATQTPSLIYAFQNESWRHVEMLISCRLPGALSLTNNPICLLSLHPMSFCHIHTFCKQIQLSCMRSK